MKWDSEGDEHVLCDHRGVPSEYRVRRDPVSGLYRAYDGTLKLIERLSIQPCKDACEERYKAERQQPAKARELQRTKPGNEQWKALA